MGGLQANQAYQDFDISRDTHLTVLEQASTGRPWSAEAANQPGVQIEENVYIEGILGADPRYKQEIHDLLLDGRLKRYQDNISEGKSKWDIVLAEQDFYEHPNEFQINENITHNRSPGNTLRNGDGDLIFLDFDNYDVHMVEAKPHNGYTVQKKINEWSEAWNGVVNELENDWSSFRPEFIFGSDVLDSSNLSHNTEYALPPRYEKEEGYVLATEQGFDKAEASEDLEIINELFFRGEIDCLVNGERPEMERKNVL